MPPGAFQPPSAAGPARRAAPLPACRGTATQYRPPAPRLSGCPAPAHAATGMAGSPVAARSWTRCCQPSPGWAHWPAGWRWTAGRCQSPPPAPGRFVRAGPGPARSGPRRPAQSASAGRCAPCSTASRKPAGRSARPRRPPPSDMNPTDAATTRPPCGRPGPCTSAPAPIRSRSAQARTPPTRTPKTPHRARRPPGSSRR